MGVYAASISSDDSFQDIKEDFFDQWNNGKSIEEITIGIEKNYYCDDEDRHSYFFALAFCQWKCGDLDPVIYREVKQIIESGADIQLWTELEASAKDIIKRKKVLKEFLIQISTPVEKPKKRVKKIMRKPMFALGDIVQFFDGKFYYAFIVVSEEEDEFRYCGNEVLFTDIKSSIPITLELINNACVYKDELKKGAIGKTYLYTKELKTITGKLTIIKNVGDQITVLIEKKGLGIVGPELSKGVNELLSLYDEKEKVSTYVQII